MQSLRVELEKALKPDCFFLGGYSFNLRLEYEGETEKIIEEIMLGHGEEPAVEDICGAVPLKHLYASGRMWERVQLT